MRSRGQQDVEGRQQVGEGTGAHQVVQQPAGKIVILENKEDAEVDDQTDDEGHASQGIAIHDARMLHVKGTGIAYQRGAQDQDDVGGAPAHVEVVAGGQ